MKAQSKVVGLLVGALLLGFADAVPAQAEGSRTAYFTGWHPGNEPSRWQDHSVDSAGVGGTELFQWYSERLFQYPLSPGRFRAGWVRLTVKPSRRYLCRVAHKFWLRRAARSRVRWEKPVSLSYQPMVLTAEPRLGESLAMVSGASKVQDAREPTMSEESSGASE